MQNMRINKFLLFLYFFLTLVLFSRQETPTGQAVLVFEMESIEQINEEIAADLAESGKIEIVDAPIQSEEQERAEEVKIEEEVFVENIQKVSEGLVEEIEAPLEKVEEQTALPPEEVPPIQEAMTIEEFMTTLSSQTLVVIGENAPIEHLISALQLAGKFGLRVVKESDVEDISAVHAISVGSGSVNALSASILEQSTDTSNEGDYFIYEDKKTGTVILVVAGETPKVTRKAVQNLLKY